MIKPLTVAAVGVTIAMFVSGCSGSTGSTSSTTAASSAAASVAASAASPMSSASASAAAAQWCAGYTEIRTDSSAAGRHEAGSDGRFRLRSRAAVKVRQLALTVSVDLT